MLEGLSDVHRDLGRLEGRLSSLENQMAQDRETNASALRAIKGDVEEIKTILAKRAEEDASRMGMVKGGWWVLGLVVSVITFASSAMTIIWRQWLGAN